MDPAAAGPRPMSLAPLVEDYAAGVAARRDMRPPAPLAETPSGPASRCSGTPQAWPQSSGRRARGSAWDCWESHEASSVWTSSAHRDRGSLSRAACRSPDKERSPRLINAERSSVSRAETPSAKAAHRRTEEHRSTFFGQPGQHTISPPSSPKGSDLPARLQQMQREANTAKAFRELTLGHKWLRIILDGIEAVLDILRPRVKNLERVEQSPTIQDLHRMTMKLHADILSGFQDLQEDCAKDEPLLQVKLDGLSKSFEKSWAECSMVKPITPEQANSIEVLLRFVTGLDMMPIWPNALEAAVDLMQLEVSSIHHGPELPTFASSTQQLMGKLRRLHRDAHGGIERTRQAMVDRDKARVLRSHSPPSKSSSRSHLLADDSEGKAILDEDASAMGELHKSFNRSSMIRRMTARASLMSTRASMTAGNLAGRRPTIGIKDPRSAALWGVTLDQLCDFHDEIIDDLCEYCETHRKMSNLSECMHVCLLNEKCEFDHHGLLYVKQCDLLDTETTENLLPDTYAVVDYEVKPRTKSAGCSLALMLNPEGIKSNIFVTHAWSEPFKELVGTLRMAVSPTDVLWICSLALNQHDKTQATLDASHMGDCPFFNALRQVKKQVVALDEHLHVPERAWCTFEIMTASSYGVNVSLWFYRIESLDALIDKVENLDLTKAMASCPEDVKRIQEVMESRGKLAEMNEHVRDVLYDRLSFHKQMLQNGHYVPSVLKQEVQKEEGDKEDQKDKAELEVCRKRLHDLELELQAQKRRQAEVSQKIHQKQKDHAEKQERLKSKSKRRNASKEDAAAFALDHSPELAAAEERAIQKLKKEEAQAQLKLDLLEEIRQSVERELREALEAEMERKEEEFAERAAEMKAEKRKYNMMAEEMERVEARQRDLIAKAKELDATKQRLAEVEEELSWVRGERAVAQYALRRQETRPAKGSLRGSMDAMRG